MKEPKPKRKRLAVIVPPLNDGTNTPKPIPGVHEKSVASEAALYKQAGNPLGDPHKI